MGTTLPVARGVIAVHGAELYHEVRGSGPPVLFVPGMTGDAGHFEPVAERLAEAFTVITYDRRGNSRSRRPVGWTHTSIEEQADDAAALLQALRLAPAAVFGTSLGGVIALDLVLRHPEVVRKAILHDTGLFSVLTSFEDVMAMTQSTIERGVAGGGPRAGVEALWRLAAGDANFEGLVPPLRARMLGNAEVALTIEPACFAYRPDDARLSTVGRPVAILTATESQPFFAEIASWLAERLHTEVRRLPGGHAVYLDQPEAFVEAIRPLLRATLV